jgi:hypothetical protein
MSERESVEQLAERLASYGQFRANHSLPIYANDIGDFVKDWLRTNRVATIDGVPVAVERDPATMQPVDSEKQPPPADEHRGKVATSATVSNTDGVVWDNRTAIPGPIPRKPQDVDRELADDIANFVRMCGSSFRRDSRLATVDGRPHTLESIIADKLQPERAQAAKDREELERVKAALQRESTDAGRLCYRFDTLQQKLTAAQKELKGSQDARLADNVGWQKTKDELAAAVERVK